MPDQPTVILIHGLVSSSLLLRPMASRLRRRGLTTRFWSYFSIRGSIEHHAGNLSKFLDRNIRGPFHLVAHSMGSIICRRALLDIPANRVGRFVMLAPPNRGSHVASRLAPKLGTICPALRELSDTPDSYVNQLGVPCDVDTGIVQAERDFVVADSSISLPDRATPTIAYPGMHSQLLLRSDVAESVADFLTLGEFRDSDERASSSKGSTNPNR